MTTAALICVKSKAIGGEIRVKTNKIDQNKNPVHIIEDDSSPKKLRPVNNHTLLSVKYINKM